MSSVIQLKRKNEIQQEDTNNQLTFDFEKANLKVVSEKPITNNSPQKNIKINTLNYLALLPQVFVVLAGLWFLIIENSVFYEQTDTSNVPSILKALLVEGMLISFCFINPLSRIKQAGVYLMVSLVFIYSLFGFSTQIFNTKKSGINNLSDLNKSIISIEKTIQNNNQLLKSWQEKGWIGNVRRLNEKNMQLSEELIRLRNKKNSSSAPDESGAWMSLIALLILRFLVQISVFIFTKNLVTGIRMLN